MKVITLKLSEELARRLEEAAARSGQSKSAVARSALEGYLRRKRGGRGAVSALELAGDFVGCFEGPGDLSTNPKYMDGFGE